MKLDNAGDGPGWLACGRMLPQADLTGGGAAGEPRLLLLIGCTRQKAASPDNPLTWQDFLDAQRLDRRTAELGEHVRPARDMFTSPLFCDAMAAVDELRRGFGHDFVDVRIVSAGYGSIPEDRPIAPYDFSFGDLTFDEARWRGEHLGLPQAVREAAQGYALVVSLLGKAYRAAAGLPGDAPLGAKDIYLTGAALGGRMPEGASQVRLGVAEMEAFAAGPTTIKAKVLGDFARGLVLRGDGAFAEVMAAQGAEGFLRVALAGSAAKATS